MTPIMRHLRDVLSDDVAFKKAQPEAIEIVRAAQREALKEPMPNAKVSHAAPTQPQTPKTHE